MLRTFAMPLCLALTLLMWVESAAGQTSYPMITHCTPAAIQRGQTAEIVVEGQQNFAGASQVLFEGEGLSAEVIPPPPPADGKPPPPGPVRNVKLRVTAHAEAAPGIREMRLLTDRGWSSVGQLLVVADPVVAHDPTNNSPEKAVPLTVPGVACGRMAAVEQSYFYRLDLKAGQTLTCTVVGNRLQHKIHDLQKHADPALALFDAAGREVAAGDDELFVDPQFSIRVPQDGSYLLRLRDSKYDGDGRWTYALLVEVEPPVLQVLPCAGQPGQTLNVTVALGPDSVAGEVVIPADAGPGTRELPIKLAHGRVVRAAFWITNHPVAEPPQSADEPVRLQIPSHATGAFDRPGLEHRFRFAAKRGQRLRLEVQARRIHTPLASQLDGFLELRDARGAVLARADDLGPGIKDPGLDFTVPADGEFEVRLRDLHGRGGVGYTYTFEIDLARPDFVLRCDGDKANVAPGGSVPWYVQIDRLRGFAAPVEVVVEGLPAGVSASRCVIPPSMTQGVVVLTAAADAEVGTTAVTRVVGRSERPDDEGKPESIERPASVLQEIYLPGGGRGRMEVNLQPVAVIAAADIVRVLLEVERITLAPGGEVAIPVKLERRPEAKDATVTLDVRLRHLGQVFVSPLPPGVTVDDAKSKLLLGKENEGLIVLRAAANAAAVAEVPIAVAAHVSVNFVVKIAHSGPPVLLTVGTGK